MAQYTLHPNGISGAAMRTILNDNLKASFRRVFNVEVYGAKHDYQTCLDASLNSTSTNLATVADRFTPADVTKVIRLFGAGVSGADLITTITAFVDTKHVTLAVAASTTIAAKKIEWGTDDTVAIQNATNACHSFGGGDVWFANGIYFIVGPLITSVNGINPNCQIYFPLAITADFMPMVRWIGESVFVLARGPFSTQPEATNGVIFKSCIVGTGTLPSVVGASFAAGPFVNNNLTTPVIENIAIQVKSVTGTTHGGVTMTHFKLKNTECKQLKNCYAFTESDMTQSVISTAGVFGFLLDEQGHSDVHSIYSNITAIGTQTAFHTEEHSYWDRMMGYGCETLMEISGGSGVVHPVGVGSGPLVNHWCKYGIKIIQNRTIEINYYNEAWPGNQSPSRWYNAVADVYIPATKKIDGFIRGSVVGAGGVAASMVTLQPGGRTGNLVITDRTA